LKDSEGVEICGYCEYVSANVLFGEISFSLFSLGSCLCHKKVMTFGIIDREVESARQKNSISEFLKNERWLL